MAIQNVEVNVKTSTGYDQLNFKTDSNIALYSNTNMTATNVKSAIDELYNEKAEKTNAEFTNSISMGRKYGTTVGVGSAVIGSLGEASGENSFHSGNQNKSTGINSFTKGFLNTASGENSEAGGSNCRAEGRCSRSIGNNTWASDAYSDTSGYATWATNICASARGDTTVSNGIASTSDGKRTTAYADYSSINGESTNSATGLINKSSTDTEYISAWSNNKFSVTKGRASRVGGMDCMALGDYSSAGGYETIAEGDYSTAEGQNTRATGICSSVKGYNTRTSVDGMYSSVEGYNGTSEGLASHTEGEGGHSYGDSSHVEGYKCITLGNYAHAGGHRTTALRNQYAIGHINNTDLATANTEIGTSTGTAFVIGNGIQETSSNAFRVTGEGLVYAKGAYSASGADLAEIYEWQDENKTNEDRRALFVTNDGTKIKIAEKGDYILGIISSAPCIIGNGDECWVGAYEKDEHGSYIYETKLIEVTRKVPTTKTIQVEEEFPTYNEETNKMETVIKMVDKVVIEEEEVVEDVAQQFYKVNPLYDPTRPYKQRLDRPEFDAVGIKGMLTLIDDGTCEVNGFCKCGGKGIATKCEREPFDTFRVIERINDKLIKVAI